MASPEAGQHSAWRKIKSRKSVIRLKGELRQEFVLDSSPLTDRSNTDAPPSKNSDGAVLHGKMGQENVMKGAGYKAAEEESSTYDTIDFARTILSDLHIAGLAQHVSRR